MTFNYIRFMTASKFFSFFDYQFLNRWTKRINRIEHSNELSENLEGVIEKTLAPYEKWSEREIVKDFKFNNRKNEEKKLDYIVFTTYGLVLVKIVNVEGKYDKKSSDSNEWIYKNNGDVIKVINPESEIKKTRFDFYNYEIDNTEGGYHTSYEVVVFANNNKPSCASSNVINLSEFENWLKERVKQERKTNDRLIKYDRCGIERLVLKILELDRIQERSEKLNYINDCKEHVRVRVGSKYWY